LHFTTFPSFSDRLTCLIVQPQIMRVNGQVCGPLRDLWSADNTNELHRVVVIPTVLRCWDHPSWNFCRPRHSRSSIYDAPHT